MEPQQREEKCTCDKSDQPQETDTLSSESSNPQKDKKSRISLPSLGFNLRRGKSLQFTSKRNKKPTSTSTAAAMSSSDNVKKSPKWGLKFNCTKTSKESKGSLVQDNQNCCQCTCYKKTEETVVESLPSSSVMAEEGEKLQCEATALVPVIETISTTDPVSDKGCESPDIDYNAAGIYGTAGAGQIIINGPLLDVTWITSVHEDCDETARIARAREIEQGVEAPPNFKQVKRVQVRCTEMDSESGQGPRRLQLVCPPEISVEYLRALFQNVTVRSCPMDSMTQCHTQVDFIHCLVPDLYEITNCSFYWGKMDRYEAERLLDGKPEGTFLLRDSAQEEFLFSVSFRKYGRSLHARIEQWNHKFSFDAHDPGVYTSDTVCGLIEHYKDPSSCMFFEPMLTWPLHRNFTFSLQHLCRSVIVKRLTYDNINQLQLPKTLKNYMKEYHYRQKVRVARFDDEVQLIEVRNAPP